MGIPVEYNEGNDNKYFTEQQLKGLRKNKNQSNIDEDGININESSNDEMEYFTE